MNQIKIGEFLKELRKEKGLTQEQLAEQFNISRRSVSRWETGSNMPDLNMLITLAEYYDVDVREIIDGKRKSENMDEEVKETLEKVVSYNDMLNLKSMRKGDKERKAYFDAKTKIHLMNYIESRADNNSALFVSLNKPHNRLTERGVELRLREMGKKLGVEKVHPHKFRRTMATRAIEKGMPIEQVQKILGHEQ